MIVDRDHRNPPPDDSRDEYREPVVVDYGLLASQAQADAGASSGDGAGYS